MTINNTIETVIFDLDGTLYKKKGMVFKIIFRLWWCLPLLIAEQKVRKELCQQAFVTQEAFYEAFFSRIAKGSWCTPHMARVWYKTIYLPTMVQVIKWYHKPRKSALLLLNECKERGIKTVLFSDYEFVEDKLKALGIDPSLFTLRTDAPTMGGLKPNKAVIQSLLDRVGANPKTTLFVGDRDDKDGESARAVGAHFLNITKE